MASILHRPFDMLVLPLVAAICLLLVAAAFLAPRWSRRFQDKEHSSLERAQAHERAKGGPARAAARGLDAAETAADKSLEIGRRGRGEP